MTASLYSAVDDVESKVLPMASAMFFGAIIFATAALTVRMLLAGNIKAMYAARHPRALPLDVQSFRSIYTILYHTSVLGLILFYAYICEYHPPYPHAPKTYNRDEFFFLTALLFLVAMFTVKKQTPEGDEGVAATTTTCSSSDGTRSAIRSNQVAPANEATELLNRDQTEEWKGWMQFMFLLYHYHHAEEVYNAIRVMITCYVWMTGFGNMSFFYIKADYSLVRVLQMLWRLNFLVLFLCWTQGTTYILYYICFLHTYYFLMVYATMFIRRDLNYTATGLRYKLTALAVIIFVVWDLNSGAFRLLHWPVSHDKPILGATSGTGWEIYFRTSLDHWSTFLGMVFACNFPIVSLFFRKLEAEPLCKHVAAKCLVAIPLLGALILWLVGPFMQAKVAYNQTNAFFAPVPLIAYIFFRNLTPWLRNRTSELLHQIGKTTLETYLMQHHIWLTSDAKSLLALIPGWPKVNFLAVSVIYVAMSRRLYQLTLFLRGMILPNDRAACLRNLGGMFGVLAACYCLAASLHAIGALNLLSVAVIAVSSGSALYSVVISRSWVGYADQPVDTDYSESSNGSAKLSTTRVRLLPCLSGALGVLAVGVIWQTMKTHGASKLFPLTGSCASAVQDGRWIPVNVCEEDFRGEAYRNYGLSSIGTCLPQNNVYTWGWKATPSSSHCHFSQRDMSTLLTRLDHRTVTFVGDSIVRHLYHAMCRQVGDASAGSYNTSLGKWQDFSRHYGTANLEFRWAPFTDSLLDAVANITNSNIQIEILVIGGGPWDRLHKYSNESEQDALRAKVATLAGKLESLRSTGISVVWVTPTTINSWALNTDEKRLNIREDQMAELREVYAKAGIHKAATWVFHGPSFTNDRTAESYDGVHYPLFIYDGGAQILANALDWLLPEVAVPDKFSAGPQIGAMAHPVYGLCMVICVVIALYAKDGFFGLSYLAGVIVPAVRPSALYAEAFASFHARMKMAAPPVPVVARFSSYSIHDVDKSHSSDEDETKTLIEMVN